MVQGISYLDMDSGFFQENFNQKMNMDVNRLKRTLTLDLKNSDGASSSKRSKPSPMIFGAPVLSSPDVKMLKLTSPEIERFILAQQNGLLATPTPSTPHTQVLFPKSENEYRGFVEVLKNELNNDSNQSNPLQVELPRSSSGSSSSGNSSSFMNFDSQFPATLSNFGMNFSSGEDSMSLKDEPNSITTIGSSPPLSPINMESQEKIKLERKRMRNRVAASKCRRRKLERIARLEDKVKQLKGENNELTGVVIKLKDEICKLKEKVMDHVQSGCQIIISSSF